MGYQVEANTYATVVVGGYDNEHATILERDYHDRPVTSPIKVAETIGIGGKKNSEPETKQNKRFCCLLLTIRYSLRYLVRYSGWVGG